MKRQHTYGQTTARASASRLQDVIRGLARGGMGLGCLLLLAGAGGAAAAVKMNPVVIDPGTVRPPQVPSFMFGGKTMTTERARAMAEAENYELIKYLRCSGNLQECVIMQVVGLAGRVFQYQVLGERCELEVTADPVIKVDPGRPDPHTEFGPKAQSTPNVAAAADKGPFADDCFAGYQVAFRAVQLDTLWVASSGHTITLEQRYETLRDNRWTTIATARASSWSYDRVPSGLTSGWAYELRDGSDKVLTSDTESWIAIASGGSTEASAAELCALKQKAIVADQQATVSKLYFAADLVPVPDEVTMDIDLKIYGFGISIGGKKNMDAAANLKEVGDDNAVKAGTGFELDCRLHPGKYFPEQFTPEPGELELADELEGFQSPFGETDLAAAGHCPSSTTGAETVDMGGGSVCTADVRRTCEVTTSGSCECTNPEVVGNMLCACEDPGAAECAP